MDLYENGSKEFMVCNDSTCIISIIIPAYNMQGLLARCVESLCADGCGISEDVEVVIVNDGSTDATLDVARRLKDSYPRNIIVVDKTNGHYGSCINAALKIVRGKYVRVLDADDSFDPKEFSRFLEFLRGCNSDLVLSDYAYVNEKGETYSQRMCDTAVVNGVASLLSEANPLQLPAITYKTAILREIGYVQTERVAYSDTEWCIYPIAVVRTVAYSKCSVYRYFIGREGQSISRYYASIEDMKKVLASLARSLQKYSAIAYSVRNRNFVVTRMVEYARFIAEVIIANAPVWRIHREFNALCAMLFNESPELLQGLMDCKMLRKGGGLRLFFKMRKSFVLYFPIVLAYRIRLRAGGGR